jgi:dimethylargininase
VPDPKHLKTYITVGGPDLLCVGAGKEAQEVLKRMEREATFSYQTLTLPEDDAANVLYLNGTLVHRSIDEIPQSFKVIFLPFRIYNWRCCRRCSARRSIIRGDR